MKFECGTIKDFYLLTTDVENIFINEYMPGAPGDYVKVYLYGLLYAKQRIEISREEMARQLKLSLEDADSAWEYWSRMGVVKKIGQKDNYSIEFKNLRELMYGNISGDSDDKDTEKSENENDGEMENCRALFDYIEGIKKSPLSSTELREIPQWRKAYGVSAKVIERAFDYSFEKGKESLRYIEAIVRGWSEKGIKTEQDVEEFLEKNSQRFQQYKKILNSLGIVNRLATDGEKEIMDKWFDEMGFTTESVLDACHMTTSISNPNLKYVNKILENRLKDAKSAGRDVNSKATVTQADLNKYYDFLRQKAKEEATMRCEEIYTSLPRIEEIDKSLKGLGIKLSKGLLSGMSSSDLNEIKRLTGLLEEERAVILTENNYNADYTDIKYKCEKCNDTGFDENGQRCDCARYRTGEAELWQKSIGEKNQRKD